MFFVVGEGVEWLVDPVLGVGVALTLYFYALWRNKLYLDCSIPLSVVAVWEL